jgi:hypothetical protein
MHGNQLSPKKCLALMIDSGALATVSLAQALPAANYATVWRGDRQSGLVASIARLAQEQCDFGSIFQTA